MRQCPGAARDDRAALPLSESARRPAGRRGQHCPLTVTFKGPCPPAHQPLHSQALAGLLQAARRQDLARQPSLTPGAGCRRQHGGPPGLARSGCPPRRGSVPRASLPCCGAGSGRGAQLPNVQPQAPCSAQAGCDSPRMDPGPRGGPGDVLKPRLSILALASHQPSPSCQPSIVCHQGRTQYIYPELI